MTESPRFLARPTKQDLELFDSLLRKFPSAENAAVLYTALDWYTRGVSSTNVFSRFLCYYVVVESIAMAIATGTLQLGEPFPKESSAGIKGRRIQCIQDRAAALLGADPIRFALEAYFECVESLNRRTKTALTLVFGDGHPSLAAMFKPNQEDGHSLNSIRSAIAHGSFSLLNREEESLVTRRVNEIGGIASDLLKRLIFGLKSGEDLPSWSQQYRLSISSCDPRATLVTTDLRPFKCKDWRIRPEWCD
jgi:hypothetical protein